VWLKWLKVSAVSKIVTNRERVAKFDNLTAKSTMFFQREYRGINLILFYGGMHEDVNWVACETNDSEAK
jgi:hypothetical protein